MTTEIDILLKAVDEASGVVSGAADKVSGSLGGIEKANAQVVEAQKKTDASAKDLAIGFSGIATAGFGLYMTIDRVEKSQFALEKANLAVTRSNEAVDQAQKNYNAALEKFGVGSTQAKDAADKLSIAQQANTLASERASLAQGNVNQAMIQGALTVIPSVITMVSSLSSVRGILESVTSAGAVAEGVAATATAAAAGPTTALTAASWGLNASLLANPLVWIVIAIAAFVAALYLAYTYCEPFRKAVDAIGAALKDSLGKAVEVIGGALTWLWNNVLVPIGNFIGAVLTAYINVLGAAFTWLYNNAVKPLGEALSWLWNNVLVPLGNFIYNTFIAYLQALAGAFQWLAGALKPVTDAVWGFFAGCGDAIGALSNTVGGFFSWVTSSAEGMVNSMTGGALDVARAMEAERAKIAEVNKIYEEAIASTAKAVEAQTFFSACLDATTSALGTAKELLDRSCTSIEDYKIKSKDATDAVGAFEKQIKFLQDGCDSTNATLQTQIDTLIVDRTKLDELGSSTIDTKGKSAELTVKINELTAMMDQNTVATDAQVEALQTSIVELKHEAERAEEAAGYQKELAESYNVMRASAEPNLAAISKAWDDYNKSGDIPGATKAVIEFADTYDIKMKAAEKIMQDYIDSSTEVARQEIENKKAMAQAARDFRDSLEADYNEMVFNTSASFGEMAKLYQILFAAGNLDAVESFVNAIASAMKLEPAQVASILASYKEPLDKIEDAVVETTDVVETELEKFTAKVTNEWQLQRASADENLPAIAAAFDEAMDAGRFHDAINVLEGWRVQYDISLTEAEQIINNFTDAQAKALAQQVADAQKATDAQAVALARQVADAQKAADAQIAAQSKVHEAFVGYADKIKADFFDRVTAKSSEFKDSVSNLASMMVYSWDSMSGATGTQSAYMVMVIQDFADKWGLSWNEAYATIFKVAGDIDAAAKLIPLSIEEQLIGKAQADFQTFKDCLTGKSASLASIASADVAGMTRNITSLIKSGLVGEAQAEMKAYVDCNTNKTASMVTDLTGMMAKLTKDYTAQLALMTAEADRLTGLQKDAVLRNIKALTADYEAKMASLRGWQQQLLDSMVTDADRAAERIKARMKTVMAAIAKVEAAGLSASELHFVVPTSLQGGGVVESPTLALIGERGKEAVVPLEKYGFGAGAGRNVNITITGPLVVVEGSADRATAELAAALVEEKLRSVIFEASSSGAPSSSKIIRFGSRVTM